MSALLVRLIKSLIFIFRHLLPLFLKVIGWMVNLATTSMVSIWVGVPTAVKRIADNWADEAKEFGLPEEYRGWVYYPASAIATITLILGWVILAYITVYLVKLLF